MTRSFWQNPWFTVPVLLFFAVGLTFNLAVPAGDELLLFNAWRQEPYNTFFRLATLLGEYHMYVFFGLPLLLWRFRYGVYLALVGLLIMPISYVSKDRIAKDRPIAWLRDAGRDHEVTVVPGEMLNAGKTSFPSGHTMAAFGLYSALTVVLGRARPRLGLLFALMAILTGLSRIFLVQHFLADILGGAFFGLLVGEAARRLLMSRPLAGWKGLDRSLIRKADFSELEL